MPRFGTTLTFVSGSVASAVIALTAMSLHGQSSAGDDAFHVCVGKDRVLRLVETEEPCPEGQERLRLQEADTPDVEPPEDSDNEQDEGKKEQPAKETEPTKPATKASEEAELKRVERPAPASKERTAPASRVKAPFEVVDETGKTILLVDSWGNGSRGISILGTGGKAVAFVYANDYGHGQVKVKGASGQLFSQIGAGNTEAGLRVGEGENEDQVRVDVGRKKEGSYAARFFGSGNVPKAAIGVTPESRGLAMVGDGTTALAAMTVRDDGKGQIEVNSSDTNVVTLTEGGSGGLLQITDKAGKTMVEAGVDSGGFGVVRAGPKHSPARMVGPAILVSRLVGEK